MIILGNMVDYVRETREIGFGDKGFNEADALVFSQIVYFPMNGIVGDDPTKHSLAEVLEKVLAKDRPSTALFFMNLSNIKLMKELVKSKRFGSILVSRYRELNDMKEVCQFAGVTFHHDPDNTFIAFRGTNTTYNGWKESFDLAYKDNIPSQLQGLKYLNDIADEVNQNLWLGGHSKGGNVAIYSAIHAPQAIKDRIRYIYSNDGPGFNDEDDFAKDIAEFQGRVMTYVPQSSIVGLLLFHTEPKTIVRSYTVPVLQHDPFSWKVVDGQFERLDGLSAVGRKIDEVLKKLIQRMDKEEVETVLHMAYEIIESPAKAGEEHFPARLQALVESIKDISAEEKSAFSNVLSIFKDSVIESFQEDDKDKAPEKAQDNDRVNDRVKHRAKDRVKVKDKFKSRVKAKDKFKSRVKVKNKVKGQIQDQVKDQESKPGVSESPDREIGPS